MFKKTFLLAVAGLTLCFGAMALDFGTERNRDEVNQPDLASGFSDPLPRSEELNFAQPEDSYSRADVVDQPSLAEGHSDPLPRAQELRNAFPVYD